MGKEPLDGSNSHRDAYEININRLADARASELLRFEESLRNKFKESNRTPMQSVPKHMRRRAMSHNRFRIPSRIRRLNGKFMKDSEKHVLRCRKHGRTSRVLLLHYLRRSAVGPSYQEGKRWLETHIFHARRMRMEVYCGFKIARVSCTKQVRRLHAMSRNGCVVYDKSYYTMFDVQLGGDGRVKDLLEQIGCKGFEEGKRQAVWFDMDEHARELVGVLVGEKRAVVMGLTCVQARLGEALGRLVGDRGEVFDITGMVNVFELIGPEGGQVVRKAVGPVCIDRGEEGQVDSFGKYVPMYHTIGSVVKVRCQHDVQRVITPRSVEVIGEDKRVPQDFKELVVGVSKEREKKEILELHQVFDIESKDSYLTRYVETRRGQYSHKRIKKGYDDGIEVDRGDKPSGEAIEENDRIVSNGMDIERLDIQEDRGEVEDGRREYNGVIGRVKRAKLAPFSIAVVNTSVRKISLNRLLVFSTIGSGKMLFRRLVIAGARPMGRIEYEHVIHQFKLQVFPKDYPQSMFFNELESQQREISIGKHNRRPYRKRANFQKLSSPAPFESQFSLISAISILRDSKESSLTLPTPSETVQELIVNTTDSLIDEHLEDLTSKLSIPMNISDYTKKMIVPLFGTPPKDLAYISYPLLDDINLLMREYLSTDPTDSHKTISTQGRTVEEVMNTKTRSVKEGYQTSGRTKDSGRMETREVISTYVNVERCIIGRVTSGFSHFSDSSHIGICYLLSYRCGQLESLTDGVRTMKSMRHLKIYKGDAIVMYRNVSSMYHHFAVVRSI